MDELLSATESLCPVCLERVPAYIVNHESGVYLEKQCLVHGACRTIVWRGSLSSYRDWLKDAGQTGKSQPSGPHQPCSRGCPFDCGLCASHTSETCSAALMVTATCNCNCPICFTGCGRVNESDPSLDEIKRRLAFYLETSGRPFPIELCGGEPTIRSDLPTIISTAKEMGFSHIQLNTNGIRLGEEPELAQSLKEAGATVVYLGFDGVDDNVYARTSGRPLLELKMQTLEHCARAGLAIVLVPVLIPGINLDQVGAVINIAKKWMPHVKGVNFQPMSYFGRYPRTPDDADRLTIPEVLELLVQQTGGEIKENHFMPPGCEHPLCSFQAFYMLDQKRELKAVTARQRRSNNDGASERARTVLTKLWAASPAPTLTVGAMLFQDAWNVDIARLKRCSIHIIGNHGLTPLCAKYLTGRDGTRLYAGLS